MFKAGVDGSSGYYGENYLGNTSRFYRMNDRDGKSFDQIADYIEENL